MTDSPAKGVKNLKESPYLERFLTPAEAEKLIQKVAKSPSKMLPFIIPFLLFTGARKSEALEAKWANIDFDRNVWTIPFTKSGKPRHVPLSKQALEVLRAVKAAHSRMTRGRESDWIFPNLKTRKPYTSVFYPWDKCRRAVGLADLRIHDLRHSFASALVNRGMTLYDVKEILGHSNILTTQRYAHLSPDRLQEAVSQAGEHYGEALKGERYAIGSK